MRFTMKCGAVAILGMATAGFAREGGIRCEVQNYDIHKDSMIVVCPPPSAFSPIRIRMILAAIDHNGWSQVDVRPSTQVELLQSKPASQVAVRLPHQDGAHRWQAWREFAKIKNISILEEK